MSKKKIRNQACHCGSGKKFKDCHLYLHGKEHIPILKMKGDFPMPILIKDEFVITGTFENKRVKLFKVFFTSDGTLNVDFPYFTDPNAILDELIIPPGINYPADITLKHTGKLTSHRVKFAHHISGEVHFSQDGKIRTEVRKKSLPLKEVRGHIFTVMLQGIDSFKEARKEKDFAHTNGRGVLNINFEELGGKKFEAIKFIGWWQPKENCRYKSATWLSPEIQAVATMRVGDRDLNGFIISSTSQPDYILFLSAENIPWVDNTKNPCLTFIGGFDKPEIVNNNSLPTSALILSSPISDLETLSKQLGSVNLHIK